MSKLLIICLSFYSLSVFANKIDILKITSNEDKKVSTFSIHLNDNEEIVAFNKRSTIKDQLVENISFDGELDYQGIVIEKRKGRKVVILRGLNVDNRVGGAIEIDYLYSGISGNRNSMELELLKDNDTWIISKDGKEVKHLHIICNRKRFLGTIGIKRIEIK